MHYKQCIVYYQFYILYYHIQHKSKSTPGSEYIVIFVVDEFDFLNTLHQYFCISVNN